MQQTDQHLRESIQRARRGDLVALGELLELHRPYLRVLAERVLDRRIGSRVDASDIVQQTCLSVHRCLDQFHGQNEAQFVAWLRGIHEHKIQDALREHLRTDKRSIASEQPILDASEAEELSDARASSPSQRLLQSEQAVQLARMLEQLPADQRLAVRLRHLEGASLAGIASRMERSEVAVAGLIKRGVVNLRKLMKNEDA